MWSDGSVYDGFWMNDQQDGVGQFTTESGQPRHGRWQEGKLIEWITKQQYEKEVQVMTEAFQKGKATMFSYIIAKYDDDRFRAKLVDLMQT